MVEAVELSEPVEKVEEPVQAETTEPTAEIGVRDLLDAGLHFGHQTKRWNPKMKRYIFDKRNGIHIIDLTKSLGLLNESLEFVRSVILQGKSILFVGTKKQAQKVIKDTAESTKQHFVTTRWLGGALTNSATIRKGVRRMREIETMKKNNTLPVHKKEASSLRREYEKLHRNLGGIADMGKQPGAMFVVDIKREAIAVAEANKLNIPVIAMVDTCCDPDPVDFVIPGNDDSLRSIRLVVNAIAETITTANAEYTRIAVEEARKREAEKAAAEAKAKAKAKAEAAAKAEAEAKTPKPDAADGGEGDAVTEETSKKPTAKKPTEKKAAAKKPAAKGKKRTAKKAATGEKAKAEEPKAEEPKAEEVKAEEVKVEEPPTEVVAEPAVEEKPAEAAGTASE